ncbi:hypothetical protein TKK_0018209 [Trichogramma kaykai]|uniref:Copia protein n=1 Tax=Trichogramma kaykai TaxID=54128 RepID=A0ABD2VZM0_9HYME
MESEIIKISTLKGEESWAVWKFQIRILFVSKGIFDIVEGTAQKPVQPTAAQITADATVGTKYTKDVAIWLKDDATAQRYIVTSIDNKILLHIINCTSSSEMWAKLNAVFENKSETSIQMLQQKWFNYTKDSSDDITTHISKVQDLCCRLKALGEEISDSMLITSEANRTIDNLSSRLIMEEARRKTQSDQQSVALLSRTSEHKEFAKNKNKKKSTDNRSKKDVECFNCKKKGYFKKDFWFLESNKHKRPSSMRQKDSAQPQQRRRTHRSGRDIARFYLRRRKQRRFGVDDGLRSYVAHDRKKRGILCIRAFHESQSRKIRRR